MRKFVLLSLLLFSAASSANVIINGTRVIYPEQSKLVRVQLTNISDAPALVQSWIDDGNEAALPENVHAPFTVTPPVTQIASNKGQELKIQKLGVALPADRESVFYLNVLDIPASAQKNTNANRLQMAIRTRIKLFYRPAGLKKPVNEMTQQIRLKSEGSRLQVINNSEYHFNIIAISQNKKQLSGPVMVKPFSTDTLSARANSGSTVNIVYVTDLGSYQSLNSTVE